MLPHPKLVFPSPSDLHILKMLCPREVLPSFKIWLEMSHFVPMVKNPSKKFLRLDSDLDSFQNVITCYRGDNNLLGTGVK